MRHGGLADVRAGEASDAAMRHGFFDPVVRSSNRTTGSEVTRNMMTIDLPTVDELALDIDGTNGSDDPTETA